MKILRQNTAVTLKVGPFVDATDAATKETALTINQAAVLLSKNDGAFAQKNDATAATHDSAGWYGVPLNATDTNTLGPLKGDISVAGALPRSFEYMVVSPRIFDLLTAADTGAIPLLGVVASGTLSGTHSATTADLGTNAPANNIAGQTLFFPSHGLARVVDSYNTSTGVATFESIGVTLADGNPWVLLGSAGLSAASLTAIAGAVFDLAVTGHTGAGSFGERMSRIPNVAPGASGGLPTTNASNEVAVQAASVRSAVGMATANLDAQLAAIDDFIDTEVGAVKTRVELGIPAAVPGGVGGLPVLDANGLVPTDVDRINGAPVLGNGTSGNLWRG